MSSVKSIPASDLVSIVPGVIGTGGSPLSLNAVYITKSNPDAALPFQTFSAADSVANVFGNTSQEYKAAQIYFNGFDNCTILPKTLFIAVMQASITSAKLVGGEVPTRTASKLKNIAGDISINIDGEAFNTTLKDSDAETYSPTSYSQIAQDLTTAFSGKATCSFDSAKSAFIIVSGTAGASSKITFASGGLADFIYLTEETGAQKSNGSNVDTINDILPRITEETQNFATIMAIGNDFTVDEKIEISQWVALTKSRYAHILYSNGSITGEVTKLSEAIVANKLGGTLIMYGDVTHGAFATAYPASLNFDELNGRTNFAFRSASGLIPSVTDQETANQLLALGVNFYGAYATANDRFLLANNGSITGDYKWYDTYVNQIYFNSQLQLALITMLKTFKLIPYNALGRSIQLNSIQDPINQFLNYGGIQKGVTLSNQQTAQINLEAGFDAALQITLTGYCVLLGEPTAQVRGNRGSFPFKIWYTDGGSLQSVNLSSIAVL